MSKLHEAQEKYQETVKSRYRDGGGESSTAAGAMAGHGGGGGGTGAVAHGPSSPHGLTAAHGSATAAGRGWLNAATGTSSSLIVPSFAVHDYGELVRARIVVPSVPP